jgi:phosphoribosylamine-glycine ligase
MNEDNNQIKKWIVLSAGWDGMPIGYHLQMEDKEVLVGQVQDFNELGIDKEPEEPKDKKQRLSQYDGMLTKHPARKLVDALKKVKNKDEYFIFCDQNNLFKYAEELLEVGFTKGLFPLEEDYNLEKEREKAMQFVEDNYAKVKIIPHQKIKGVEEAKKAVEESELPLVLQSEGDYVATICPCDDVEKNHTEILAALDKYAKDYERGEIILKEKLIQPIEITPQIVFWDGKPVYTSIDIETKNIGDGENNGNQVGCGSNLIISTEFDDRINEIAFPPIVYAMAKKRKGFFIWDISLYITEKGIYFGEFCSNRLGYDASMTEMTMAHGPGEYFEKIMSGENPISDFKFGTAIRVFNLNRSEDTEITLGSEKPTWLYEVRKDGDKLVSVGDCWDLGVITGRGNTISEAVDNVYENYETLSFKEKYCRTKADFLADYPTSIIHRYITTNNLMFEAPDFENEESEKESYETKLSLAIQTLNNDYEEKMNSLRTEKDDEIEKIRGEIKDILNG